jgi:hypothetical protein
MALEPGRDMMGHFPETLISGDEGDKGFLETRMRPLFRVAGVLMIGCTAVSIFTNGAPAEIRVTRAAIDSGDLIVTGQVIPRRPSVQMVVSPGKTVPIQTNTRGSFSWSGPYFPNNCSVKLTAGTESRDAIVQDCGLPGPPGPPGLKSQDSATLTRVEGTAPSPDKVACPPGEKVVSAFCHYTSPPPNDLAPYVDVQENSVGCNTKETSALAVAYCQSESAAGTGR